MARGAKKESTDSKKEVKVIETVGDGAMRLDCYWVNPKEESNLVAFCNLVVADVLIVKCSLMYSPKKEQAFLLFPQSERDGKYYSQALPANKEAAEYVAKLAEDMFKKLDN